MKIGIIGLPQTGKKTLFHILTGTPAPEHAEHKKPVMGTADIRDQRFDELVSMYRPKKEARARIDIALVPKLEAQEIQKGTIFGDIQNMDALCHVVRAFEDEAVYHVSGSIDPLRDIESVNQELILHDLLFIETRTERIEQNLKKVKDAKQQDELVLLGRMKEHLEQDLPLRMLPLEPEEDLLVRSYPFITRKEMIIALNVSESELAAGAILEKVLERYSSDGSAVMQVSAKVEAEIAALESEAERREFFSDLGITEHALEKLGALCIRSLGLISFFTVGEDEVRQWLVRRGATAPEAAGVIHSDLQRGFIRAEVMKYPELKQHKTEAALKAAGKLYVKGKEYIVEEGDILNIRFNI